MMIETIPTSKLQKLIEVSPPTFRWIGRDRTDEFLCYGSLQEFASISEVRKELRQLSLSSNDDVPLIAYTFAPFFYDVQQPTLTWIIPKILIHCHQKNQVINFSNEHNIEKLLQEFSYQDLPKNTTDFQLIEEIPSYVVWEKQIQSIHQEIQSQNVDKVVLSRQQVYPSIGMKSTQIFQQMKQTSIHHYKIQFRTSDGWFQSVTPERLLKVSGTQCWTDSLAGSMPSGKNLTERFRNSEHLFHSEKEQLEHSYVVQNIVTAIQPFLKKDSQIIKQPNIKILDYIQHLYTSIQFDISDLNALDYLISELHPTAAIVGSPRRSAMRILQSINEPPRGYYSGLAGWCTTDSLEIAVLIRSAFLNEHHTILYGGAGIVQSSDTKSEWQETELKMSIMKNIFVGALNASVR